MRPADERTSALLHVLAALERSPHSCLTAHLPPTQPAGRCAGEGASAAEAGGQALVQAGAGQSTGRDPRRRVGGSSRRRRLVRAQHFPLPSGCLGYDGRSRAASAATFTCTGRGRSRPGGLFRPKNCQKLVGRPPAMHARKPSKELACRTAYPLAPVLAVCLTPGRCCTAGQAAPSGRPGPRMPLHAGATDMCR